MNGALGEELVDGDQDFFDMFFDSYLVPNLFYGSVGIKKESTSNDSKIGFPVVLFIILIPSAINCIAAL